MVEVVVVEVGTDQEDGTEEQEDGIEVLIGIEAIGIATTIIMVLEMVFLPTIIIPLVVTAIHITTMTHILITTMTTAILIIIIQIQDSTVIRNWIEETLSHFESRPQAGFFLATFCTLKAI